MRKSICEAVTRPTMRFVAIKSPDQQAVLMLHRTRDLLVRQRTMLVNALRGHLAEFGIIAPQGLRRAQARRVGREGARHWLARAGVALHPPDHRPTGGCSCRIAQIEHEILAWHRTNEMSQRLRRSLALGSLRQRTCGHHPGSGLFPLGPTPGCLDRLGAATERHWRQGAAGHIPSKETDTCAGS